MDEILTNTKVTDRYSISHLLMSERLEESGSPKLIISSIMMLFFILIILVVWAAYTVVDEVATGNGEIVPIDKIEAVQHLEGGIVYRTYVKDGAVVEEGKVLFELNPEPHVSDLKRLKKRQNSLEIEIFRLQAVLQYRPVNLEGFLQSISYKDVTDPALLKLQLSNAQMLYEQQLQQKQYNRDQLENRLAQERVNLKNIEKQLYHFNERKKLLEDEVSIYDTLAAKQATSRINLINTQDRLQEVVGDLLEVVREQTKVETTILDLESQLRTLEFNQENQALEELNDLTAELLEVQEQITRAKVRVERLQVVANSSGVIKGLELRPGSVIAPAELLFEIVPISDQLIAEIEISTNDIGHVHVGDKVQVKVTTYDFATYGQISGILSEISASTFLDDENNPYYKGVVTLDKNYLGDTPGKNLIFPGMVVTADIKTTQKSLLEYLLKPLNRTFNDAFSER